MSVFSAPQDVEKLQFVLMAFLLMMARFSGFFAISPFFSRRAMSRVVRQGIVAVPAMMCTPLVVETMQGLEGFGARYLGLALKEFALGYLLGMLTWLPVRGLELAGAILDTQTGNTQGQDLDIVFGAQTTTTAILLSQVFSAYFFASGGYLIVTTLLFESVRLWPPAALLPQLSITALPLFLEFAGMVFFTAVAFVLPISGFLILADIVIAFVARTAQSLNALTFGTPVKSAILLTMLGFYLEIAYPRILAALSSSVALLSKALGT